MEEIELKRSKDESDNEEDTYTEDEVFETLFSELAFCIEEYNSTKSSRHQNRAIGVAFVIGKFDYKQGSIAFNMLKANGMDTNP